MSLLILSIERRDSPGRQYMTWPSLPCSAVACRAHYPLCRALGQACLAAPSLYRVDTLSVLYREEVSIPSMEKRDTSPPSVAKESLSSLYRGALALLCLGLPCPCPCLAPAYGVMPCPCTGACQGNGKASLAMSCLALPGESLLSIERIRRLISSIERRREGTA